MANDLKIQGVVEMSSEGAERAFDRVGQKSDQMAAKVAQSSAQAGQAVDQIGTGANRNADEFTRAEGRIVSSIKRATTELQNLGKTASQRLELRIDTQGLDRAKFEPLLANLRELEAAQNRVAGSGRSFAGGLQNTSYQLQDFIVQVNGGTDATRALAMQLPQMLIGFGALGAGIGVVAALLPNIVALFGDSANEAESLKDAMSGMDDAISQVGRTVSSFDMEGLYEEFNAASDATRAATIEQLNFQRTFIETQRLVSQKAFSESLTGIGDYGFLDKLSGGGSASTRIADDLGVTLEVAQQLEPVLKGLRDGTEDVGAAFTQFGTKLLSGNKAAVDLATAMRDLANGEKDAYAASSALSEALERMAKGHVTTKKEADEAAKSSKAYADEMARLAQAGNDLVQSLLGQSTGLTSDFYKKWDLLGKAYKTGAIGLQDLTDAQGALLAQQPAMKRAAKDAEDYGKALASTVGALEDRALALETELANYGLTKAEIDRTTIARLEEVRAMAAANGATEGYLANLDREIAARRRIAQATAGIEAEEANRRAAEQAAQDWQRTADNIEKALVDALMEGGKSGKEYIEGLFRTMVLRPIVQAIVQPVAGSITSAMGFGAPGQGTLGSITGAINGVSNLSSLYGAVTGGMTASLGSLAASAGSMFGSSALSAFGAGMQGSTLAAGLAGPTTAGASGAMGLGSMAGAALPWVAGAFGIASLLGAFDKKPSDKTSAATLDIGSGRVTDVWDMGGKKAASQEQKDANTALSQLAGSFARQAGLTGQLVTAMGSRDGYRLAIEGGFDTPQGRAAGGSWLGGKETAYSYGGDAESALRAMLDDLVDEGTLPQATIDAWRAAKTDMLGAARDATELVSTLNLLVAGYDTATIERANLLQAESEALEVALGRMLQIEAALTDTALPGDALAASAAEMARRLEALALGSVPTTTKALGELVSGLDLTTDEGRKTYQSLMALAPAFVEIQAAQRALYDQLYTDEQRAANLAVEVGDAFAQLGLTLPTTRDEMRALIDAQDGTAEAGAKLKAQLLGLVPAFVQVASASEAAAQEITRAAERAAEEAARAAERVVADAESALRAAYSAEMQAAEQRLVSADAALRAAYETQASEIQQTIDKFAQFGKTIRSFREELAASARSEFGGADAAKAAWQRTMDMARLGDQDAMGRLVGDSRAYIDAARKSAVTEQDYLRTLAQVDAGLASTESIAETQARLAKKSLDALQEQVGALIKIDKAVLSVDEAIEQMEAAILADNRAALTEQVSKLIDINTSVLSVRDAIAALAVAKAASAAPPAATYKPYSVNDTPAERQQKVEAQTGVKVSPGDSELTAAAKVLYQSINGGASTAQYNAAQAAVGGNLGAALGWDGSREGAEKLRKVYGFAAGGYHPGGLRLVGEQGPELEVTGPARIYSADQTRAILGGSNEDMVRELRALRAELAELKAASAATARSTSDTARILTRATNGGNAMLVETAA